MLKIIHKVDCFENFWIIDGGARGKWKPEQS